MKKIIFYLFILSAFLKLNAQYSEDCETAMDAIDEYVAFLKCIEQNSDKMCDAAQTAQLSPMSHCKEASDYLQNLIQKEDAEPMRCHLIRYLGWTGDAEYIPFLKQLLKKEERSANEKQHILFAFIQLGKHSDRWNYEKTFSVFEKALFSENSDDIFTALQGLNAIGTEPAYLLMKSQTQHEEVFIALTAQKFCMNYEKKGGKL